MEPTWETFRGTASVFENLALLEHGRTVHHRLSEPTLCEASSVPFDNRERTSRTSGFLVSAVRSPWCLSLEKLSGRDAAPARALYTEFGWLARSPTGRLCIGDGKHSSLGSYGLSSLLAPTPAAALRVRRGELTGRVIEINAVEIESDLIFAAPELVVLGAEFYRVRWTQRFGVIELWEGLIAGALAMRIDLSVGAWNKPVEFFI